MTSIPTIKSLLEAGSMRPWTEHPTRDAEVCINSERDGEYLGNFERPQDAALVVALVNAAPQLLAIAEAAMAWRDTMTKVPRPSDADIALATVIDYSRGGR